jgi:hypothetical protein
MTHFEGISFLAKMLFLAISDADPQMEIEKQSRAVG